MFERFTTEARDVVVRAQEEARALGHPRIGAEHLVLAALARPDVAGVRGLVELGLTHATWREATVATRVHEPGLGARDEEDLRTLGIDLGEVRRNVEAGFGPGALAPDPAAKPLRRARRRARQGDGPPPGHIPFTPLAKQALTRSLRETLELGEPSIGPEHLLLGVLAARTGPIVEILAALDTSPQTARQSVLRSRGRAA